MVIVTLLSNKEWPVKEVLYSFQMKISHSKKYVNT